MANILTVSQTAEKLQITEEVVREYLRTGKIPGRKVGKSWRVVETDLENWISAGAAGNVVSARGFLKQTPGNLSSERFMAEKHAETEEEEQRAGLRKSKTGEAA